MIIIDKDILELKELATIIRRDLHKIPESGFKEYKTADYIKTRLKEFGVDSCETYFETALIAVIKGSKNGETIAFRSDMDGLPVIEETGESYKSINKDMMHACGHDGHMAILLTFAKYLISIKDKLEGDVVLIFQPAEEGPGGAEPLVKAGIMEKYSIKKVIGSHIFPEFPQGFVACRKGSMMARNGEVTIKIKGKSSHGAQPQKGIDALVCAAALITGIQTIISRNLNPLDTAVLTFGTIFGGEAKNIIAKEVVIGGTLRAFNDDVYHKLTNKITDFAKNSAIAYGCEAEVNFYHMYRIVKNDGEMVEALKRAVGQSGYIEAEPVMISEDFSFFQEVADGVFFFLGSRNEEKGYTNTLHSAKFNFDEITLLYGIQAYKGILKELW